ncbi:hypothetical protein C5167_014726 [Papaver somniferum]|uniref:non-specific serine/threonine protein kinase n=1 Tax=Papaver somniferum TaxID=3469 RepID=A0A4Y7J602_PAPSO|nr:CBL-interacting serine/threonine-protein kinase 14-like [Papaver somniferum]RZC55876.1 hypothetical protein C5167_014726 [Papaver somniferum]
MEEETESSPCDISPITEQILFEKYQIGRLLGCGAFAKVYHARNIQTGQNVAIKAISKQKIMKSGFMPNIKREISIMRQLHHPYIVKLFEVLATKAKIYFVMEFVKGGELFSEIAKCRFSEDLSRRYFQQLISAVGYCHSHGVFHRDLKPENLLLDENGDLKVSDFGLSAVTSQEQRNGLLYTSCGTPAYVAPEILARKGYSGAKIDIWSCGVILFVLNSGYLPFNCWNLSGLYRKIYRGEFRVPKWTSPGLQHLISRLLDTNPMTRITVDEIIQDPWFSEGYNNEIKFHEPENNFLTKGIGHCGNNGSPKFLNAFDIISFSRGIDLSGLFKDFDKLPAAESHRFITAETPVNFTKMVSDVAAKGNLTMTRKDWNITLEGPNGKLLVVIEMYQLTESLAVVEIQSYEGVWKKRFQPHLSTLVYHPGAVETRPLSRTMSDVLGSRAGPTV